MLGAIAGDIIGSVYENRNLKRTDFPLWHHDCTFTDDTVLTIALADSILTGVDYVDKLHEYYHRYPSAGYGPKFMQWARWRDREPYNSWGNGSAMRVSPAGWAFETLEATLEAAERSAAVTHNHPEGIKGAQAAAACIFLARTGHDKDAIREYVRKTFRYGLRGTLDEIRPSYRFDVSCQGSVPEAIIAFLESNDYEDAVRKAISLGGDSDTIACITGGIAHAFYGRVPDDIASRALLYLDDEMLSVVRQFGDAYGCL